MRDNKQAAAGSALKERLLIIALNIVIFGVLFVALRSDYLLSLGVVLAIIVALLVLDRFGVINRIFSLYLKHKKTAFLSALAAMLALPFLLASNRYVLHIAVLVCIYSICSLGLNFQMGSTDMGVFSTAAFFGTGAYASAVVTVKWGLSPWLGLLFAVMLSLLFGLLIGAPTLRTKGYYLSLITMAFQLIFTLTLANIKWLGGPNGIIGLPAFNLFGWDFGKPLQLFGLKLPFQFNYLIFLILVLIILTYIAMRVNISRTGLAFNVVAQDEVAANCFGINVAKTKLLAFCLGAVFCGIAGAIYAHYMLLVVPDNFEFSKSLIFICMMALGGMDNPIGVITGSTLLIIINEKLRDFADYQMLFYGLILLVVLLVRPAGLLPKRVRNYCECFKLDIQKREKSED